MTVRMHVAALLGTALAISAVPASVLAQARGSAKPACGITYLPLAVGNSWTYEALNSVPPQGWPQALVDSKVVVTVVSVEKKGADTEITLEETFRDKTTTMVATCNASGLTVPAESFLFAAEPGPAVNMSLTNVSYKGTSYPAKKLTAGAQIYSELDAELSRASAEGTKAQHDPARVRLERLATVGGLERVTSALGDHRATRVEIKLLGFSAIGEKQQEVAAIEPGALWIQSGLGVVRAQQVTGRVWQLTETNVGAKPRK